MVPGVGTYIFAKSVSNENQYEKAVVHEKNLKKLTVKYLNGQKQTFSIRQFDSVVWNVDPNPADLRVGTLVIVSDEDSGREQIMILGRLREIKTNARKKTSYIVDKFDGKSIVVNLAKLRIIPEVDQTGKFSCPFFSLINRTLYCIVLFTYYLYGRFISEIHINLVLLFSVIFHWISDINRSGLIFL